MSHCTIQNTFKAALCISYKTKHIFTLQIRIHIMSIHQPVLLQNPCHQNQHLHIKIIDEKWSAAPIGIAFKSLPILYFEVKKIPFVIIAFILQDTKGTPAYL